MIVGSGGPFGSGCSYGFEPLGICSDSTLEQPRWDELFDVLESDEVRACEETADCALLDHWWMAPPEGAEARGYHIVTPVRLDQCEAAFDRIEVVIEAGGGPSCYRPTPPILDGSYPVVFCINGRCTLDRLPDLCVDEERGPPAPLCPGANGTQHPDAGPCSSDAGN